MNFKDFKLWLLIITVVCISFGFFLRGDPEPVLTTDSSGIGKVGVLDPQQVLNKPTPGPLMKYIFVIRLRRGVDAIHHVDVSVSLTAETMAEAKEQLNQAIKSMGPMGIAKYNVESITKTAQGFYCLVHTGQTSSAIKVEFINLSFTANSDEDAMQQIVNAIPNFVGKSNFIDYDIISMKKEK